MQTLCLHVPHFKIKPFSVDCGPSPSALSMQMMQPMQPMQPRFVPQQALPRQPAVLSYARPAQPWRVGQVQHQLPTPMQTVSAGPMAMPSPIVKAMVKPLVKPPQWVYAAPLLRTPARTSEQSLVFPVAKPNAGLPTPQLVSVKVTAPERKELPLIDGQVPRDAGVEGMHPVEFKAFWEQNLFKIFKFLSTSVGVPIGFTCMPWVSMDHLMLVLFIESSGFLLFCCHKIVHPLDLLVCPSPGISKTWLLSTCAVKTAQVATSEGQFMSQPWISSRRSRHTWKSFGTSRLWHSFASIRHIGRRQWLDAS